MLECMLFHPPIVSQPLIIVSLQVLWTFREEIRHFDVFSSVFTPECMVCDAILPATLVQFVFVVVFRSHTDCCFRTLFLLFVFDCKTRTVILCSLTLSVAAGMLNQG